MLRQALVHYSYVTASCIALFAFLMVFGGALLWVFRKNSKPLYDYVSDLPLRNDEEEGVRHE